MGANMTRLGYALGYAVRRAVEANATDPAIDFSGRFAGLVTFAMRMQSSQRVMRGVAGAPAAVANVWFFIVASHVERTWETVLNGQGPSATPATFGGPGSCQRWLAQCTSLIRRTG